MRRGFSFIIARPFPVRLRRGAAARWRQVVLSMALMAASCATTRLDAPTSQGSAGASSGAGCEASPGGSTTPTTLGTSAVETGGPPTSVPSPDSPAATHDSSTPASSSDVGSRTPTDTDITVLATDVGSSSESGSVLDDTASTPTSGANGVGGPLRAEQLIRVMPFGDSITATGCWRDMFLQKVAMKGYHVDMVGSNKERQCNETDVDNEGHSGKLITQEKDNVAGWARANPADVVLFHWGTNDVWKSEPISDEYRDEILSAYTTAVAGLRSGNPRVIVIVAQIIPLNPANCAACPDNVRKLNAAIPAWASEVRTEVSPVIMADLWTGFDPATGTSDGAHPYTDIGVEHMASRWYEVFTKLF